jgi:hypothetical protein
VIVTININKEKIMNANIHRSEKQHPIYVGGERLRTTMKMHFQIVRLIVLMLMIAYPLVFWGVYEMYMPHNGKSVLIATVQAQWYAALGKSKNIELEIDGSRYVGTPDAIMNNDITSNIREDAIRRVKIAAVISLVCMIPVSILIIRILRRVSNTFNRKHIRGPQLLSEKETRKRIRTEALPISIPLSPHVKLPIRDEILNILVSGAPGVGKTVFFSQAFEEIRSRGCKVICHDFKGDYVGRFYNPKTDLIFNPLDARSVRWPIFNEICNALDLQAVSHSLIPPSVGEGRFWNDGSRDVFSGLLRYLYLEKRMSNANIWNAVSSKATEIKEMLLNADAKAGARYVEDASSKQSIGILSSMMQYVSCFEYLQDTDCHGKFSLSRWLTDTQGGALFITNYADCQDVLRPILSLMIDLIARRLLSLPDDLDRRVFFLLDEFPQLQNLPSIERLLTTARSKGGSVFIGIQDVSQIRGKYGREGAQTILNACGTSIIFRSPDPDTGQYFGRRIGETEYYKYDVNFSISPEDVGDRQQMTLRRIQEMLISPAQIQHLPNLAAFVSMVGRDIFKTQLAYKPYTQINKPFVLRSGLDILPSSQQGRKGYATMFEATEKETVDTPPKKKWSVSL